MLFCEYLVLDRVDGLDPVKLGFAVGVTWTATFITPPCAKPND
jgi:hypothetical protein